jgi:hypothetical protein
MLKKPRTHNRCFPTPARLMSHQKFDNSCRYYVTIATTAGAVGKRGTIPSFILPVLFYFIVL